jgi:hypothetical protein
MAVKKSLKTGEKVLFGVVGVFIVLAVIGYVVMETVRMRSDKPLFQTTTHFDLSAAGQKGSVAFRESGCTSCHRALRNGTNMGLSLDGLGSVRSYEWILQFLTDPESVYPSKTIDHGAAPKEAAYVAKLPEDTRRDIAAFLSGLTADQGSSSARVPPEGRSEFIDSMVKTWAPEGWREKYSDVRTKDQPAADQR